MKQRVKQPQKHDNLTDGESREDASQKAGLSYKQTDNRVEQKTDDTKLMMMMMMMMMMMRMMIQRRFY